MNQSCPPLNPLTISELDEGFHFLAYPSNILVWSCDTNGACDFVSPSWTTFTGRAAECEWGEGWLTQVHPDDLASLQAALITAKRERKPFRALYRYRRADGIYRWLINQGMVRTHPSAAFAGHMGQCFDVTAYQEGGEGDAEIELSAQRMIALLMQTRLIATVVDKHGRILFTNSRLCQLLECRAQELINAHLFKRFLAPSDRALLQLIHPDGAPDAQFPTAFESELMTSGGDSRCVLWHSITLPQYGGQQNSIILIGDDVTETRRIEARLMLTASVFDSTNQAMLITDAARKIISVNAAFTALTGYAQNEALGQDPKLLQSGRHDKEFYAEMWRAINETGHWRGDLWDRHKTGRIYPKCLSISAIRNKQGELTHYAGIFFEISERKAIEERLDFLAHYDALTGLANRSLLFDRLKQSIGRAMRDGCRVGLLYLDLDQFKMINDVYGHFAGDNLLKAVAKRMTEVTRASDTVARLGGDEFVVLLPDMHELLAITQVAEKILAVLSQPHELDGVQTVVSPSIGISVYPDDTDDMETLLRHGDAAMYHVKQTRVGGFSHFHELSRPGAKSQ